MPVEDSGLVPESEPVLNSPGKPDVELPEVVVAGLEEAAMVSFVKLLFGLREVNTSEETGVMVEDMPEPGILEAPVGPTLVIVELGAGNGVVGEILDVREADVRICDGPIELDVSVEEIFPDMPVLALPIVVTLTNGVEELIPVSRVDESDEVKGVTVAGGLSSVLPDPVLAVGYDPVPDPSSLELLSGKGVVDKVLDKVVPENAVTLLFGASEEPGDTSVAVDKGPVPGRLPVSLFVGVVELPRE